MDHTNLEAQVEEAAEKAGGILRSKFGIWALGVVSFTESALPAPIITDPFLVAYIIADKKSVWIGTIVTIITSVIGGLFAYVITAFFFDYVAAHYLVGAIGEEFNAVADRFDQGTLVITILGAVTPIPYTIVAMAAGFVKASLPMFILGSVLGRIFRYGVVAWLSYHYGRQALAIAKRRLPLVTAICFILAAVYFYLKL